VKCLFSHYSTENYIPNYVVYYLEKLQKICDEVILLTNDREFSFDLDIEVYKYDNSGYDFGMYYKYLTQNNINCEHLILANDSVYLFNNINFLNKDYDLFGLTDNIEMDYHIQSYFWVLNKRTQLEFIDYLYKNGITEKHTEVIKTYEVGFCQHLLDKSYTISSYINGCKRNLMIHRPDKILSSLPIIKKKVYKNSFTPGERSFLQSINYDFNKKYDKAINKIKEDTLNLNYLN